MLPKKEADTADTSRKTLFGAAGSWRGIDDRRPKSWIGIIRGPRWDAKEQRDPWKTLLSNASKINVLPFV